MTTTPTIEQMADAVEEDAATVWALMPKDANEAERTHHTNLAAAVALLRTLQEPSDEAIDTMRRAVSHCGHAPHTRAAMRAVLSAITGEGE